MFTLGPKKWRDHRAPGEVAATPGLKCGTLPFVAHPLTLSALYGGVFDNFTSTFRDSVARLQDVTAKGARATTGDDMPRALLGKGRGVHDEDAINPDVAQDVACGSMPDDVVLRRGASDYPSHRRRVRLPAHRSPHAELPAGRLMAREA